jgi:hypothetical protein
VISRVDQSIFSTLNALKSSHSGNMKFVTSRSVPCTLRHSSFREPTPPDFVILYEAAAPIRANCARNSGCQSAEAFTGTGTKPDTTASTPSAIAPSHPNMLFM